MRLNAAAAADNGRNFVQRLFREKMYAHRPCPVDLYLFPIRESSGSASQKIKICNNIVAATFICAEASNCRT